MINWRVLSPNTLRAYTIAARDFEAVTGVPVQKADVVSIARFRDSMEGRKLSVSTIRQRLSAVAVLSGVRVELPRRATRRLPILSAAQVRALMSKITDRSDRILLGKLLVLGPAFRSVEFSDGSPQAHIAGEDPRRDLTTRQITRRLKRYAKRAGLDETQVTLRVWCASGQRLVSILTTTELVELLGNNREETSRPVAWKRLHGIGRRRAVV